MDIKFKLKKGLCLFLIFYIQLYIGQVKHDTLQRWMGSFAAYTNLQLSPNNRWVLANKSYDGKIDTLCIFDIRQPGIAKEKLVKMNIKQGFIGNKGILLQGFSEAEYISLENFNKITYNAIKKLDILSKSKSYVILDEKNILRLFDENGNEIKRINNVEDYTTDKSETLIAISYDGKFRKLSNVLKSGLKVVYSTENKIAESLQFSAGKFIAFAETDKTSGGLKPVLFDIRKGLVKQPMKNTFVKADFMKLTEIKNGKAFMINFEKKIRNTADLAEIWYGNDKYLRFKKRGNTVSEYYLWISEKDHIEKIADKAFTDFISINNEELFLAFNNSEHFDYQYSMPVYPLYIFDRVNGSSKKLCNATRNVIMSLNGKYIVMFNELKQNWELFDILTAKNSIIQDGEIQKPLFSDDEKWLLFESKNGIQVFDLEKKKFTQSILIGKETSFVKSNYNKVFEKYNTSFIISSNKVSSGILIKSYDRTNDTIGYYKWNGNKITEIIPDSVNDIRDLKLFNDSKNSTVAIEESYNKRSQIYLYDEHEKQKICLSLLDFTNLNEKIVRKIVSYKNSKGQGLKGILYYPMHFDQRKQYPMVVSIYQEQSINANKYPYPLYGGDGFNIRLLIEKGYFVFLPDTIVDDRGSGIAALDSVESGLDYLSNFYCIDNENIGLIGHSFGAYETNFISTQSNRFKAFVSGAGVSDLIGRYFTYNSNYGINEYSRIENGQYQMRQEFSKAKEKYIQNNPIYQAENVKFPILLWAGVKDNNVSYNQSLAFYTSLLRNRKDVILLLYKDQEHVLMNGSIEAKDLALKTLQWWDYFLKEKKDVDWIDIQIKKDAS